MQLTKTNHTFILFLSLEKDYFYGKNPQLKCCGKMVGTTGFEPATPTTPRWCATKLRYVPLKQSSFRTLIK